MTDKKPHSRKKYPGSGPSQQKAEYPKVPGIDPGVFALTAEQQDPGIRRRALEQLEAYMKKHRENFLGYQVNHNLSYSQTLSKYLDFHINNIGDPFQSGNFMMNSKFVERAVLDYFASLWNAKWPHNDSDPDSYWGYVLSMGSSEGNIYAMWNARDYLAGRYLLVEPEEEQDTIPAEESKQRRPGHGRGRRRRHHRRFFDASAPEGKPHTYTPIAFFSDNTHYSIIKNTRVLNIATFSEMAARRGYRCPLLPGTSDYPAGYSDKNIGPNGWPHFVPSNEDGSIYIPALVRLVDFFSAKGYPVLLSFNYGSTFKGALDDVKDAVDRVIPILKRNNMYERTIVYDPEKGLEDTRTGFWVHVDGALGAGYAPFLRKDKAFAEKLPVFDFSIPELHSIIMSGHKWLGAPWPCGIFMSKVKYQLKPVSSPAYIGSSDSTFSGSRNGFSSMLLWDYISRHSVSDLTRKVKNALADADYFMEQFRMKVERVHKDIPLWLERSPNALTIHFRRPGAQIVRDFSLSNESLYVGDEQRDYSHIFIMDHVTRKELDCLIEALTAKDAFDDESGTLTEAAHEAFPFGLGFR